MSDVSGIPNMGFGGGNFFAPQFSYNPQINPTAGYAAPAAYAQNVQNNAIQDVQYDQKLFQHYYEQSLFGVANTPAPEEPGHFTDYNAGGDWPTSGGGGGGDTSLFQGGGLGGGVSLNNNAWNTSSAGPDWGPGTGFSTGGGGLFSGNANSLGGGGGYNGPTIDWSGVGNAAAGMSAPSGAQPFDWSLFGGAGAKADPAPGMSMPGGLNAPMTFPPPPQEVASEGKSSAPPPFNPNGSNTGWGDAPATAMPSSQALLGYDPNKVPAALPTGPDKGLSPDYWANALGDKSAPEGTRTYNFPPMFEGGGGGGFGGGGAESQLYGAPAAGSLGGSPFGYFTDPGATKEAPGPSAEDMAGQARDKLAKLMGGDRALELAVDPTASVAKEPGAAAVPLPRERPAEAPPREDNPLYPEDGVVRPPASIPETTPAEQQAYDAAPRPPADVKFTVEPGKEAGIRGVQPRLAAAMQGGASFLPPGYTVEAYSGARNSPGQAYHSGGRAMDVRIIGPDGPIPSEGADSTGMYQLLARGVKTWAAQNDPGLVQSLGWGGAFGTQRAASGGTNIIPDLMHFDLGGSRGSLQPNMQFGRLQPLSAEEQNAMPANIPLLGNNQVPLDAPGARAMGVNQGQDIPRPSADISDPRVSGGGFNALDAAATEAIPLPTARPAAANIAQANSVLDSKVLDLVRQNSPGNVDRIPSSIANQTLREALGNTMTGSAIRAGLTPYLPQMGVSAAEFDKAYAGGQQAQPPRFGDTGGTAGGELPTAGSFSPYPDFRESSNFENRSAEQPPRDQLAALQAAGTSYEPGLEVASTPLGAALGLGDLPLSKGDRLPIAGSTPETSMRDFVSPEQGYSNFQQPASSADLAKTMTFGGGFSPSPEPRQGGVGPEVTLSPEHMQTMAEVESHNNPALHDPGSQYKGLYQLNNAEFRKYGGTGDIYDYEQNYGAAGRKMIAEGQRAQDILGRELSPVEQYMVHQQGLAGTLAHLANPDQPAWKSFQSASGWSDARAKTAIWGNLSDDMKAQFGNDVNNITSRDFINLWNDQYASKAVAAGLPRPGPGGYFNASP